MKQKFRDKLTQKELRTAKVEELQQELKNAKSIILFSSRTVSHKSFEEFRVKLTEVDAKLRFVKNTLFKVACESLNMPKELYTDEILTGPTAAIYILADDFLATTKALHEQFGKQKEVSVKIGLLDKEVYNKVQILQFASIPSANELKTMLVTRLNSPIQKLHYSLTYNLGKLVRSLKAISRKGDE